MGVAATNLPVHHVDAAPAPAAAAAPVAVAEEAPAVVDAYTPVAEEKVMTPSVQYAYLPYAQNYEYYGAATPVVQAAAPVVQAAAPVVQAYTQAAPVVQAAAPVVQAAPLLSQLQLLHQSHLSTMPKMTLDSTPLDILMETLSSKK